MRWDSVLHVSSGRASVAPSTATSFPKQVHILIYIMGEQGLQRLLNRSKATSQFLEGALSMIHGAWVRLLGSAGLQEGTHIRNMDSEAVDSLMSTLLTSVSLPGPHSSHSWSPAVLFKTGSRSFLALPLMDALATAQSIALGLCLSCLFQQLQIARRSYKSAEVIHLLLSLPIPHCTGSLFVPPSTPTTHPGNSSLCFKSPSSFEGKSLVLNISKASHTHTHAHTTLGI